LRRRRKPWGTVFNSQTGQPIPYATIKLFDKEYDRLIETAVTDTDGRFSFLVKKGEYYLTAQKPNYAFPSQHKVSEYFEHLYTGGTIHIGPKDESITYNIAIDPKMKLNNSYKLMVSLIKISRALNRLRVILLAIGLLLAIFLTIKDFNLFYILSVCFYILVGIWEIFNLRRARPFGVVTDAYGEPIDMAIVRIYEKRRNRLVETDVTDKEGRFKFLVNPGIYYVTAIKPNFLEFKSNIMYLEKERTVVSVNIKMKKAGK
jgi:5-hydroxyisourate hydrolase-like protein (transthyretin family)